MVRMRWIMVLAAAGIVAGCPADEPAPPATPGTPPPAPPAAPAPAAGLPEGVTADMVAQGQQLFGGQGLCHVCHGAAGVGGPLGPALTDADWIHIDGTFEQIETVIRTGVAQPRQYPGIMPPMGGARLSDDQVRAITAYVYSISHGG
jgi:mono/diheme cytochrome c family protein